MALKILLGAGHEDRKGWTHHDLQAHSQHIAVAHDLNVIPWPWQDNEAEAIDALDVLEHLANTVAFMDEAWRILRPRGLLTIRVPDWKSENAWGDPTHLRAFAPHTFEYFNFGSGWWNTFGHLYTTRAWRILSTEVGGNITCTLMPVKA